MSAAAGYTSPLVKGPHAKVVKHVRSYSAAHVNTLVQYFTPSSPISALKWSLFTAYRSRIKISRRSICHSPYLSHHSQKRRHECSPAMPYGTREAAIMVAADVQIAFLA